ncbi:MAG: response regulator [Williamsia sp.]|nr:response regulator [Williamsia sp.]
MPLLKIGIVEDEIVIARTIMSTLNELGYSHCGPAINFTEAMEMVAEGKPDLLLLDIQLSGKKDGIDVAEKINQLYRMPFIFLTANSDADTIERAKKVKPHAYIVKPFSKEELFAAIEIAISNFTSSGSGTKPGQTPAHHTKDFMFVKDGYVFRKLLFTEILYLESDANYVTIHLRSNKKIMVRSTLNDIAEQIDQPIFIRVHRSYAVNVKELDEITPAEITISGAKIPIGKSYKEELFRILGIKYD